MKLKILLFAVLILGTFSLYSQKPMEDDPYLLWQTTEGYSGFVIHPNGNIIANRGAEIFELDGNTGQVIRKYPQFVNTNVEDMDVTKDGKIFGAGFGNIILYDLENDTVIGGVSETNGLFAFFPDSKRFIARSTKLPPSNLLVYNMDTKERTELGVNYVPWAIATSPDGKYFATGGTSSEFDIIDGEVYYTILTLWDAETLQPIKELDKIGGDFEVRSIKFSPDGKYVGFQVQYNGIYVYKIQDLNFYKHYNSLNVEIHPLAFTFLNSDMISFISLQLNEKERFISIHSISNNILKYRYLGKTGFGTPAYSFLEYNPSNNSLVLNGSHLFAFDINKMITTVEESPIKTVTVNYTINTLILTGLNSISSQVSITISDISGRVVRKFNSPVTNPELRIPLKLQNGTYLIHIQDGNQKYSTKFLVTE